MKLSNQHVLSVKLEIEVSRDVRRQIICISIMGKDLGE